MELSWIVVIVLVALAFDFTNGFHDSANAIATSISTKALSPVTALGLAAILNIAGAFIGTDVANTLGRGIVEPLDVNNATILAALLGAIAWNMITWYYGMPSSSSHALIGGLAGAVMFAHGLSAVKWNGILYKIIIPTVLSPIIGFTIGLVIMLILYTLFKSCQPGYINKWFRLLQTVSASLMALSHGSNDAQKTMGVITLALVSANVIPEFKVPYWVIIASAVAIGAGTFSGGKRIIKTMGMKMVDLQPIQGFAAETSASAVLFGTALMGYPVSTTHVITSSIMGVGASRRFSAVRWGVTFEIFTAWILTLPASAIIAGIFYRLLKDFVI